MVLIQQINCWFKKSNFKFNAKFQYSLDFYKHEKAQIVNTDD